MDGVRFEKKLTQWLREIDFQVFNTSKTGDRGVDIIAQKDGIRYAIQAKHYSRHNLVGSPAVQKTSGLLARPDIDKAIVVTTSSFTSEAHAVAENRDVELVTVDAMENERAESPSSESEVQPSPDIIGQNVGLTLLGMNTITAAGDSSLTLEQREIDGVAIALELSTFGVADHVWFSIDNPQEVKVTTDNGEVLSPVRLSEKPLAKEWQTHDPTVRTDVGTRDLDIDIRISDRTHYFLIVCVDSPDRLKRLEIERYDLVLHFEEHDISEKEGLPSNLIKSLHPLNGVQV